MQGAHQHTWVAVAPSKSGAGHVMSSGSSRLSPAAGCADMPQIERRAAEAARRGALTLRGSMLATPTWPIYKAVEAYLAAAHALVRFLSANASTPCPVSVGQPSQVGGRARPSLLGPARAEGWVQSHLARAVPIGRDDGRRRLVAGARRPVHRIGPSLLLHGADASSGGRRVRGHVLDAQRNPGADIGNRCANLCAWADPPGAAATRRGGALSQARKRGRRALPPPGGGVRLVVLLCEQARGLPESSREARRKQLGAAGERGRWARRLPNERAHRAAVDSAQPLAG